MWIGPYAIDPPVILAPMAGVTDRPFRLLCRRLGAGLCISEMTSANPALWGTEKSRLRRDHAGEPGPIAVQIAGHEPAAMAEAARVNVAEGAQIIDLNFGCPAKKVCRADAGSALMRDPALIEAICRAVVAAVPVPVTLKMRTGLNAAQRNALEIARRAEQAGIAAVTVHGRTRDQHYTGFAEYETVAAIKRALTVPVIANGDIDGPAKARTVLETTGCDAVMIGRAAQGRPWIFRDVAHHLATGGFLPPPGLAEIRGWVLGHLEALYDFYGEGRGLRVARKHLQWFAEGLPQAAAFWAQVRVLETARAQYDCTQAYFDRLVAQGAEYARAA